MVLVSMFFCCFFFYTTQPDRLKIPRTLSSPPPPSPLSFWLSGNVWHITNFVFDFSASLTGCVICKSAHIGEKSELKDCLVGASHNVMAMGKLLLLETIFGVLN